MTMVYIRDAEEDWFVRNHAGKKFNLRLGAEWNKTTHSFQWKDKTPLVYTHWDADTARTCTDADGCCEIVMRVHGTWVVAACSANYYDYTVCQKDLKIYPKPEPIAQPVTRAPIVTPTQPPVQVVQCCCDKKSSDDYELEEEYEPEIVQLEKIREAPDNSLDNHGNNHGNNHVGNICFWIGLIQIFLLIVILIILIYLLKVSLRRQDLLPIGWSPPSLSSSVTDSKV